MLQQLEAYAYGTRSLRGRPLSSAVKTQNYISGLRHVTGLCASRRSLGTACECECGSKCLSSDLEYLKYLKLSLHAMTCMKRHTVSHLGVSSPLHTGC